jgi:hypothetical protein
MRIMTLHVDVVQLVDLLPALSINTFDDNGIIRRLSFYVQGVPK